MFSKPNKPATTASAPSSGRADPMDAPRKAIACSLIAENVSLEGDLVSDGDVQLDGAVRGDLKLNHLTIGEPGQVDGLITAETVEVRGRVTARSQRRRCGSMRRRGWMGTSPMCSSRLTPARTSPGAA